MTLADRIREAAERRDYWDLVAPSDKHWERNGIAYELGCPIARVTEALKRSPKMGRPRNPKLNRCINCGQPLPKQL